MTEGVQTSDSEMKGGAARSPLPLVVMTEERVRLMMNTVEMKILMKLR